MRQRALWTSIWTRHPCRQPSSGHRPLRSGLRADDFHRRRQEAVALVRQVLADNPHTTLQVVLEPAANLRRLSPAVLESLLEACHASNSYLDWYYSLHPAGPAGAKRLVVAAPECRRGEVDGAWIEAVGHCADAGLAIGGRRDKSCQAASVPPGWGWADSCETASGRFWPLAIQAGDARIMYIRTGNKTCSPNSPARNWPPGWMPWRGNCWPGRKWTARPWTPFSWRNGWESRWPWTMGSRTGRGTCGWTAASRRDRGPRSCCGAIPAGMPALGGGPRDRRICRPPGVCPLGRGCPRGRAAGAGGGGQLPGGPLTPADGVVPGRCQGRRLGLGGPEGPLRHGQPRADRPADAGMSAGGDCDDFRSPRGLVSPQQFARRVPPPSAAEMACWRRGPRRRPEPRVDDGPQAVQGWPVHEPQWKREILRAEVEE